MTIPIPILLSQLPQSNDPPSAAALAWRWGADYQLPSPLPAAPSLLKARPITREWLGTAPLTVVTALQRAIVGGYDTPSSFLEWAWANQPELLYGLILRYYSNTSSFLNLTPENVILIRQALELISERLSVWVKARQLNDYTKLYQSLYDTNRIAF